MSIKEILKDLESKEEIKLDTSMYLSMIAEIYDLVTERNVVRSGEIVDIINKYLKDIIVRR
jgi:hypothetical protein